MDELGNVPSVVPINRDSRIHGLMAVSKLSYNEAERLLDKAEEVGRSAIDIWAEELLEKSRFDGTKSHVV